jgi:hypothetical protein
LVIVSRYNRLFVELGERLRRVAKRGRWSDTILVR